MNLTRCFHFPRVSGWKGNFGRNARTSGRVNNGLGVAWESKIPTYPIFGHPWGAPTLGILDSK